MTHNEEFLYKKIKNLESQCFALAATVGFLQTLSGPGGSSVGNPIYEGTDDPNAIGKVPDFPDKPAVYNRYTLTGDPYRQYWWSVSEATWL